MLDISIPDLRKALKKKSDEATFLTRKIRVTEKFDGVKLTLFRNAEPWHPTDPFKNWVVSYKGMIIHPEEFNRSIRERSMATWYNKDIIGTSQWWHVFQSLKWCQPTTQSIPCNTEFFLEFMMHKPTLTREYGGLRWDRYLIGYNTEVNPIITEFRYTSPNEGMQTIRNNEFYHLVANAKRFPVLYEGPAFSLDEMYKRWQNATSTLNDVASEGVVIRTSHNEIYKIVATDQHNKEVRAQRKSQWQRSTPELETEYWADVNELVKSLLVEDVKETFVKSILRKLSHKIYTSTKLSERYLPYHEKKNDLQIRDDIFLTAKLRLEAAIHAEDGANGVGVVVLAAKPLHAGHWSIIETASQQNQTVVVFVSTASRKEISSEMMHRCWRDVFLPHFPKNVRVVFSDSPFQEAKRLVEQYFHWCLTRVYTGDEHDRWNGLKNEHAIIVKQERTIPISGTMMRKFLTDGDKRSFQSGLPPVLTLQEKNDVWDWLSL